MSVLIYFDGASGVLALNATKIIGLEQRRTPTEYPTSVLLDGNKPIDVRNSFADAQERYMAALTHLLAMRNDGQNP